MANGIIILTDNFGHPLAPDHAAAKIIEAIEEWGGSYGSSCMQTALESQY